MVEYHPYRVLLTELDIRDAEFSRNCLLWMGQAQCEIAELIANGKKTLAQLANRHANGLAALASSDGPVETMGAHRKM